MEESYSVEGKWIEDLNKDLQGSDRSCAVLAGALVDDKLKGLLEKYLLDSDNSKTDKLFGRSSPLDSFSTRIELARRLNLISAETRKALDWLRDIRNKAAHHPEFSFQDNSNIDVVTNIVSVLNLDERAPSLLAEPYDGAKGNFVATTIMIVACLEIEEKETSKTNHQHSDILNNIKTSEG